MQLLLHSHQLTIITIGIVIVKVLFNFYLFQLEMLTSIHRSRGKEVRASDKGRKDKRDSRERDRDRDRDRRMTREEREAAREKEREEALARCQERQRERERLKNLSKKEEEQRRGRDRGRREDRGLDKPSGE